MATESTAGFDWSVLRKLLPSKPTKSELLWQHANAGFDDAVTAVRELQQRSPSDPSRPETTKRVADKLIDLSGRDLRRISDTLPRTARLHLEMSRGKVNAAGKLLAENTGCDAEHFKDICMSAETSLLEGRQSFFDAENATTKRHKQDKILKRIMILLPTVLGLVASVYFLLMDGMQVASIEAVFPHIAKADLSSAEPHLNLVPSNFNTYFDEFSKLYFGHPNEFGRMFLERPASNPKPIPPDDPTRRFAYQRWKIVLKNGAWRKPTFVSCAQLHIRLCEPRPFPWHRVDVTPHVKVAEDLLQLPVNPGFYDYLDYYTNSTKGKPTNGPAGEPIFLDQEYLIRGVWPPNVPLLSLVCDGKGPAFNVRLRSETQSGLSFHSDEFTMLPLFEPATEPWLASKAPRKPIHQVKRQLPILGSQRAIAAWVYGETMEDPETGREIKDLIAPLFRRSVDMPAVDPWDRFQWYGNWYEIIRSVERLGAVTRIAVNEDVRTDVRYDSVDGLQHVVHITVPLPRNIVLYQRKNELLEYDPRGPQVAGVAFAPSAPWMRPILAVFAERYLGPPSADPKGVDLLSVDIDLDAHLADSGEVASATIPIERFFNVGGALIINARVIGLRTGRYRCDVVLGSELIRSFQATTLVPDSLRFTDWYSGAGDMAEADRLQPLLRKSGSVSKP